MSENIVNALHAVRKNGKWYVGGDGVSSWNDLEDRPFGEESVTGEIKIEYDGDQTGKIVIQYGETALVKVSDLTPEPSELIGGTASFGEDTATISAYMIDDVRAEGVPLAIVADLLFIVYSPLLDSGVTEAGMYVVDIGLAASLQYTGTITNITKIDPKYLPDDIGNGSLPEATADDDGKVLTVKDGQAVWVEPSCDADGNHVDPKYPNLIYTYQHTGNVETYVTGVDVSTGVFTSPGHGLANNATVVVTVDVPYNIGQPYNVLPTGLTLGDSSSNITSSTLYYVNVIDENSFTLSLTSGGDAVSLTANAKMDVTKFHFEQVPSGIEMEIQNVDAEACLIVVKGKVYNSFRWVRPSNTVTFDTGTGLGNRTGGMGYDTNMGVDSYGSCNLGRPGYNYTYATVEIKTMGNQLAYQVNNEDYVVYSEAGAPTFKHSRKYYNLRLTSDLIENIRMYGTTQGGFFNGTTVEVYTK